MDIVKSNNKNITSISEGFDKKTNKVGPIQYLVTDPYFFCVSTKEGIRAIHKENRYSKIIQVKVIYSI